jgi:hypothetical protein
MQANIKTMQQQQQQQRRRLAPAMTPVPSDAGCSTTPAALNQASLRWGMVPAPTSGTSTMFCTQHMQRHAQSQALVMEQLSIRISG